MPAHILPHMKPSDPREQDVRPEPEHDETDALFSVRPGRVNFAGILIDAAHADGESDPYSDRCSGCGEFTYLHLDLSGCIWIGCTGALRRKEMGYLQKPQASDPYLWGDQHPEASRRVRLVLQTAGYTVTDTYNDLPQDQQMQLARRIAVEAVRGYLRERQR